MNKNAINVAAGVVAVVLAYALYETFNRPSYKAGGSASIAPVNPGGGTYSAADPGEYLSTDELIYGAVTGSPWDGGYASIDDIFRNVTGAEKPDSVVRLPGGYW